MSHQNEKENTDALLSAPQPESQPEGSAPIAILDHGKCHHNEGVCLWTLMGDPEWEGDDEPEYTAEELAEIEADFNAALSPTENEMKQLRPLLNGVLDEASEIRSLETQAAIGRALTAAYRSGREQEIRPLWPLVHALERACWKRKWSEVKKARKALEAQIGKRPHDPLFYLVHDGVHGEA